MIEPLKNMISTSGSNIHIYDSPAIRQLNGNDENSNKEEKVFQANLDLRNSVYQSLKENKKTLNIGGDHSMGLGSVSAFLQAYPTNSRIIWIDAHADMNTRSSSPSGNYHGMPLSFILGLDSDRRFPVPVNLDHHHLTYVGIRDLDPFEIETIEKLNINVIKPDDLKQCDSDKIHQLVANYIGREKIVHISWDVDSTDPITEISATGTQAEGGIKCSHVKDLIKAVAQLNTLVSMDLTELNLDLAKNDEERQRSFDMTLDVIKDFIQC